MPDLPVLAHPLGLRDSRRAVLRPEGIGVGLPLKDLEGQALGRVERNVAVQQPVARVVRLEGDDDEAVGGQQDDVAAGRVDQIEIKLRRVAGVRLVLGLLENGEVVAVEVDLAGGI